MSGSPTQARGRAWVRVPAGAWSIVAWSLALLAPLAIMVIAWQPVGLEPAPGVDASWQAGLAMASHGGITFGSHFVFTYGPLGFLSVPQIWYHGLAELSFAYTCALRLAVAAGLFLAARATYGAVPAFLLAIVVASVDVQLGEMVVLLIVGVIAISRRLEGRQAMLLIGAAGAVAAVELLIKISIGISLAAMTAVLAVSLPGRRRAYVAAGVAGAVPALPIAWLATGQPLGALPDYLLNAERIVSGYAAAMGVAQPGLGWTYTAAFMGLALGVWAAVEMSSGWDPRSRVGIVGLWLVFWFFAFKEGFVRQDVRHVVYFFEALLGGFVAFQWPRGRRGVGLACTAALLVCALAAQSASLADVLNPSRNITAAWRDLRNVVGSSRSAAVQRNGRAAILGSDELDAQALRLVQGRTVAVFPWEIAVVWAYGLNWDPLPVAQSYSAYTTALDNLDAADLSSARAPQRILLGPVGPDIDQRVLSFDEPATSRAIMCRYTMLHAASKFAVLGLGSDRCSAAPSPVSVVHADWGQAVPVPQPPDDHSLIFVRIGGAGTGAFEQLRALLWKPGSRYVIVNGGVARPLVTGTASDGLPLAASPGVDLKPPFSFSAGARTIAVTNSAQQATGGKPIVYSFFAQSFS